MRSAEAIAEMIATRRAKRLVAAAEGRRYGPYSGMFGPGGVKAEIFRVDNVHSNLDRVATRHARRVAATAAGRFYGSHPGMNKTP